MFCLAGRWHILAVENNQVAGVILTLKARVAQFMKRRRAARIFGVNFVRSSSFELPRTVRLNGVDHPLSVPAEAGQRDAFVELLLDDCYQLRTLAKRGRRIDRILDIGANAGLFGVAARAAFPYAKIHAYEPNAALEPYLAQQARFVGADYFIEAVGREAGLISLDIGPQSVMSTTRSDPKGTVAQIPFGETLKRLGGHVDLVKMDCEGAEWEIFEDPESWRHVDYLTMEYHLSTNQDHDAISTVLRSLGFDVTSQRKVTNFGLVFASRTKTSSDRASSR